MFALLAADFLYKIQSMLDVEGRGSGSFCDGVSRRDFLRVGSLGMGGLSLPQLLQAEKAAGVGSSNKAIIMVYMAGAPPHQDLIDPKPDAPKEVRSEFGPIRTNVTGIHVNESLPMMAKIMDKWTGIRTLVGAPAVLTIPSCATRVGRVPRFSTVPTRNLRETGPASGRSSRS